MFGATALFDDVVRIPKRPNKSGECLAKEDAFLYACTTFSSRTAFLCS